MQEWLRDILALYFYFAFYAILWKVKQGLRKLKSSNTFWYYVSSFAIKKKKKDQVAERRVDRYFIELIYVLFLLI